MEPSAIFHKSTRNLLIFAGLLFLVAIKAVEIRNSSETPLLPFQIKDPIMLLHVLGAITLYCYYRFCWAWFYQSDEVRAKNRIDFFFVTAVFLLALGTYGWMVAAPLVSSIKIERATLITWTSSILAILATAFSVLQSSELMKRARQIFAIRQETIKSRLSKPGWQMLFNPATGGQKSISFEKDGTIGEGKNENESRWEIVNEDELLIWRADGNLHNRFHYNPHFDLFKSEQPDSKLGLLGQAIFRPEVLMSVMGAAAQ